jgi:hypothetical protein
MVFDYGSIFGMSIQLAETAELSKTETVESPRKYATTRSQLSLVGNGLYRHVNGTYHACKYVKSKPKWKALETDDRKIAERKQRDWIAKLDEINVELARMTLGTLIDTYMETRKGKGEKTQKDDKWMKDAVISTWEHGLDIRVSDIIRDGSGPSIFYFPLRSTIFATYLRPINANWLLRKEEEQS